MTKNKKFPCTLRKCLEMMEKECYWNYMLVISIQPERNKKEKAKHDVVTKMIASNCNVSVPVFYNILNGQKLINEKDYLYYMGLLYESPDERDKMIRNAKAIVELDDRLNNKNANTWRKRLKELSHLPKARSNAIETLQKKVENGELEALIENEIKNEVENEILLDNYIDGILTERINQIDGDDLPHLYNSMNLFDKALIWDIVFLIFYSELNKKGRVLFQEELDIEWSSEAELFEDDMTRSLRDVELNDNGQTKEVTHAMIINELNEQNIFLEEYISFLEDLRYIKADDWEHWIRYHKIMSAYPDEMKDADDRSERETLVEFLWQLFRLPSLRREGARELDEVMILYAYIINMDKR